MRFLNRLFPTLLVLLLAASPAAAFCGFYVAKADTELFNQASKVVIVRDGDRTVLTMANDFQGETSEFAVVVPVPTFLEREQINVGDRGVIEHLDAYTAPRLVEYYDEDPCQRIMRMEMAMPESAAPRAKSGAMQDDADYGVTVEAEYTVGEYDILILSAEESNGLERWLLDNDYRIPDGASKVLGSYIRQNMRFFVARVNLKEQARLGFSYLRPLQVAYESRKFMLPIRLGTVNAQGPQDLFAFILNRTGRVETTNYRTIRLPSNLDIPVYVRDRFGDFYTAMFDQQVKKDNMRAVYLEYAWDMGWCDPCAADPLSTKELRDLGVFWLPEAGEPGFAPPQPRRRPAPQAQNVFVTRLHVRYTGDTFPEDLMFQETGDRQNFQGRYILRHAWTGEPTCPEGRRYYEQLAKRQEKEAQNLANLTGWDINDIRDQMGTAAPPSQGDDDTPWWKRLWKDEGGR